MSEGQPSRRDFLGGLVAGGVASALGCSSEPKKEPGASPSAVTPPVAETTAPVASSSKTKNRPEALLRNRPWVHPSELLASISPRKKKLFVVSYVGQPVPGGEPLDGTFADCAASIEGGADAVILINENMPEGVKKTQFPPLSELEEAVKACRARFPELKIGVNWLGDDKDDPYGYKGGFRLARENGLCLVWTDVSGIDLIKEAPALSLHEIAAARPPGVFYASGIHMKYTHLFDEGKTIEESALQAMGWLDGIIVTGPKTGSASDPEIVKRTRKVIGTYPLGVASDVTAENVATIRDHVDFYIVHTGIQEKHRIVAPKVKALRAALDVRAP
jgi:predicted TIM-barrel enzyme